MREEWPLAAIYISGFICVTVICCHYINKECNKPDVIKEQTK
jgi:hypothetical protein